MNGLVFLLLLSTQANGMAKTPPPRSTEFRTLQSAERFMIGPIGFAGSISKEELAFRAILKEQRSRAMFLSLASSSTAAGQMYGMLGLKLTTASEFESKLASMAHQYDPIPVMEGCEVFERSRDDVLERIRKGTIK